MDIAMFAGDGFIDDFDMALKSGCHFFWLYYGYGR